MHVDGHVYVRARARARNSRGAKSKYLYCKGDFTL